MKNKTLKNLIAVGIFAIFVFGYNSASAAIYTYPSNWTIPVSVNNNQDNYQNGYNYNSNQYYNNNAQQQYYYQQPASAQQPVQQYYYQQPTSAQQPAQQQPTVYYTQQPYTYVQAQPKQQVQYVAQPATQIQYVPQQQTVNTQGASVVRSANTAVVANKNTGATGNTGQYVNYDANSQNMMLASAYGSYNGQMVSQPVYDSNGVTALSVKGSGGFMPSSIFQWILVVLLILGIVIIARMVSKSFSKDSHASPVH